MKIKSYGTLWLLCLATLLTFPAFAQESETFIPDEDLGISSDTTDYAPYPKPDSGYVTDLAGLLTRDQEEKIEQRLWTTESKTGVEIAVVTIQRMSDYPGGGKTIETFARKLFNKYGIGNMPKNDGVLLIISRDDRKARIELGAYYELNHDADATRIMQKTIIPYFKNDDYAGGIIAGVDNIILNFAGIRFRFAWEIILYPIGIIILTLIAINLFKQGKSGWGWLVVGFIIAVIIMFFRVLATISEHSSGSSSSSWGSGGFGGGFGGGFSGGGGATGSW